MIKQEGFLRDRYWYYREYGNYCKQIRKDNPSWPIGCGLEKNDIFTNL